MLVINEEEKQDKLQEANAVVDYWRFRHPTMESRNPMTDVVVVPIVPLLRNNINMNTLENANVIPGNNSEVSSNTNSDENTERDPRDGDRLAIIDNSSNG